MSTPGGFNPGSGLGVAGLAGPLTQQSFALPAMSKVQRPYVAHLYDRNLVFKRTLGGATVTQPGLLNKPGLKLTQNGGFQAITLELSAPLAPPMNLLTLNQAGLEADTTGWAVGANCTIAQSAAQAIEGTKSLALTSLAAGDMFAKTLEGLPGVVVSPNLLYTARAAVRAAVSARSCELIIWWYKASGAYSDIKSQSTGAQLADSAAGWTVISCTDTAPADAAFAAVLVYVIGTVAGAEVHYADEIGFAPGALRPWVLGGTVTPGIQLGDVIRLTEDGDNTGAYLFSGNVETVPEQQAPSVTHHQVTVVPWVTELGDGFFNQTYAAPVDVAQWVRDAVATTGHCSVSPVSCPNTGILLAYDFQNTTPLDAIHVAKQAAGANYWYGCDEQGLVWFQPVYTDANHPAMLTLRKGAEAASRNPLVSRAGRMTKIPIVGGNNTGDGSRLKSLYDGSAAAGFVKAFNPTLSYPSVTNQATLDAIAASLGALYDRDIHTDEVFCPALGLRLTPWRPGGLTARVLEQALEAMQESVVGVGTYGPTLIVQDVERDGPSQRLFLGEIPFTDIDPSYEAARVAQRTAVIAAPVIITPPLAPSAAPPTTIIYGAFSVAPQFPAMGCGLITIGSATFTTPKAGTCQIVGQLDYLQYAWDNYVAAPRRGVRMVLSGAIFTGAYQEGAFGFVRQTFDGSSASGISLPAGTYTVSWQINEVESNQGKIFSGWGQVAVTA